MKEEKKKEFKREFSAGGVVFRKKDKKTEYLLIKDGYGRWGLPKGHYEEGEKGKETALREIEEETGLSSLKVIDKLSGVKYFFQIDGKLIFKVVNFFLVQADNQVSLNPDKNEIQDAQWFLKKEMFEKNGYKNIIPVLKEATKKIEENGKL